MNAKDLLASAGKKLGLPQDRAHRVANTLTSAPAKRWEAGIAAKVVETVPQVIINRTIAKSVEKEVAKVIPKGARLVPATRRPAPRSTSRPARPARLLAGRNILRSDR